MCRNPGGPLWTRLRTSGLRNRRRNFITSWATGRALNDGAAGDGRAGVAQAIGGLRTALEGSPYRICGGQSGTGRYFPPNIMVFLFSSPFIFVQPSDFVVYKCWLKVRAVWHVDVGIATTSTADKQECDLWLVALCRYWRQNIGALYYRYDTVSLWRLRNWIYGHIIAVVTANPADAISM